MPSSQEGVYVFSAAKKVDAPSKLSANGTTNIGTPTIFIQDVSFPLFVSLGNAAHAHSGTRPATTVNGAASVNVVTALAARLPVQTWLTGALAPV